MVLMTFAKAHGNAAQELRDLGFRTKTIKNSLAICRKLLMQNSRVCKHKHKWYIRYIL